MKPPIREWVRGGRVEPIPLGPVAGASRAGVRGRYKLNPTAVCRYGRHAVARRVYARDGMFSRVWILRLLRPLARKTPATTSTI